MLVSLNGILQAPVTSFTVSGSTLTFASNLATGDVIDFVILLGNVLDLGTVSDGTITNAKLAQDIISGETELASAPADTDEFLVSDAGTLKRIDYSLIKAANTPIVSAYSAGDQSVSNTTWTQITFGTEEVDSDSAFASSTFTVPSGKGGKYLIVSMVKLGYENNTTQKLSIYKNDSSYVEWSNFRNDSTMDATQTISAIISLAATDTIKIYNWQGTGGTETISAGTKSTRIDITRLIE
jgi:hypothetical protein